MTKKTSNRRGTAAKNMYEYHENMLWGEFIPFENQTESVRDMWFSLAKIVCDEFDYNHNS